MLTLKGKNRRQTRQRGFFMTDYFSKRIKECLPRRIKRMIFLASVTAIMAQESTDDKAIAAKLNSVLKIAYKDDAAILPMYIKKWIWSDMLKNPYVVVKTGRVEISKLQYANLAESDYSVLANFFKAMAPQWLNYGSDALVTEDLRAVFRHVLAV